ncbi:hypothetical protein MBLNU459_g7406t1 [Dothideomycetes sp. NU459]
MVTPEIDAGPMAIATIHRPQEKRDVVSESLQPIEIEEGLNDGENSPKEQSSGTPASPPLPSKARTIALVVTLTGAGFMNTLTVQAVVIVLPTIAAELSIPIARQQWIVSAYSLAFGCFLLLWGRLADVYGKRLIFIYGSAWVSVLTLVNPFATNEIAFDVLRGLQGLGGAANVPAAIGIISNTFPPGKARNLAISAYSSGAPMGSVFGNLLGGLVAQYASWKWIFWIVAMISAVVTVAGYFIIPRPVVSNPVAAGPKAAVDWIGGMLITTSLMVLLFALTEGNIAGWRTPWISVLIVVAIILLACFVLWQLYLEKRTTRSPLMKVAIFGRVKVSAAMFAMAAFFSAFNSYLIFATYFYQEFLGLDPIQTTIRFIPTGVVGVFTVFITSFLISRVSINLILMWGMACVAISTLLMAVTIPPSTTYWAYGFPAMCLAVFGADTLYPSLTLFTTHNLPREDQALGGALINAVGQTGRAIGLAIGTAIQVAVQASHERTAAADASAAHNVHNKAYLDGLRSAQWLNVALAGCGFVVVGVAFRGAGILGAHKK